MIRAIVLGMLCVMLGAKELKEHYWVMEDKVFSTLLFPQSPSFVITSFGEQFEIKIPVSELSKLFESRGFSLGEQKLKEVKFSYRLPWDDSKIKDQIRSAFETLYASYKPQVKEIWLKPLGNIKGKNVSLLGVELDEKAFRKNRFVVMVEVQEDGKRSLKPFYCEIVASLEAYVAFQDLRAGEDLGLENIALQRISFSSFTSRIATKEEILSSSLRSFVSKDQVLLSSKLKPKVLVRRGDWIDVKYQEKGVVIESRLEAMQNGAMNDEIMARNPESKKQIKIKIIGERKAIVR